MYKSVNYYPPLPTFSVVNFIQVRHCGGCVVALVVVISLFVRAACHSRVYYTMTLSTIPPTMDIIVVSDFSLYKQ